MRLTPLSDPSLQSPFSQFGQTSEDIAKVILDVAMCKQPHLRYQTSEISKKIAGIKLSDITGNQVVALTSSRLSETNY